MWIKFGPIYLSAVLNKGPYSTCLAPHIAALAWGKGVNVSFPAHWPIWNAELDWRKRRASRISSVAAKLERYGAVELFKLHIRRGLRPLGVHIFLIRKGKDTVRRTYISTPFKTFVLERKVI